MWTINTGAQQESVRWSAWRLGKALGSEQSLFLPGARRERPLDQVRGVRRSRDTLLLGTFANTSFQNTRLQCKDKRGRIETWLPPRWFGPSSRPIYVPVGGGDVVTSVSAVLANAGDEKVTVEVSPTGHPLLPDPRELEIDARSAVDVDLTDLFGKQLPAGTQLCIRPKSGKARLGLFGVYEYFGRPGRRGPTPLADPVFERDLLTGRDPDEGATKSTLDFGTSHSIERHTTLVASNLTNRKTKIKLSFYVGSERRLRRTLILAPLGTARLAYPRKLDGEWTYVLGKVVGRKRSVRTMLVEVDELSGDVNLVEGEVLK